MSFTSGLCAQENIDEHRGCFGSKKWSTEAQLGCALEFIRVQVLGFVLSFFIFGVHLVIHLLRV